MGNCNSQKALESPAALHNAPRVRKHGGKRKLSRQADYQHPFKESEGSRVHTTTKGLSPLVEDPSEKKPTLILNIHAMKGIDESSCSSNLPTGRPKNLPALKHDDGSATGFGSPGDNSKSPPRGFISPVSSTPMFAVRQNRHASFDITGKEVRLRNCVVTDSSVSLRAASADKSKQLGKLIKGVDVAILGTLGGGQCGQVQLALHGPTGRLMALKCISVHQRNQRHQLVSEIENFKKMDHENIVKCLGGYYSRGKTVLALEYMNLGSLETMVKQWGSLPPEYLRTVMEKMTAGLEYLHKMHIIHRDFKPANVLIDTGGNCKITDFGLAKQLDRSREGTSRALGTQWILSPERLLNETYTFSADIWSLGVTVMYCATSEHPVPIDYWSLIAMATHKKNRPELDKKKFPAELCAFVNHCLEWEPKHRWSATKLLEMEWFKEQPKKDLKDYLKGRYDLENGTPRADKYCGMIGDWIKESKDPERRISQVQMLVDSGHVSKLAPNLHVDDGDLKKSLSNLLSDSQTWSSMKLTPMSTTRAAATLPTPEVDRTTTSHRASPGTCSKRSRDFH